MSKLVLPEGLLIPHFERDEVTGECFVDRLRIRKMADQGGSKYHTIAGSMMTPLCIGVRPNQPAFVFESDLDAILVAREAGDLVGVVAMGSVTCRPNEKTFGILKDLPLIIAAFDSDGPGALESHRFWKRNFRQCLRCPIPRKYGKDPGEAFRNGLDLRVWVASALKMAGWQVTDIPVRNEAYPAHPPRPYTPNVLPTSEAMGGQEVSGSFNGSRPAKTRMSAQDSASATAVVMEFWRDILLSGVSNPHDGFGDARHDWNFFHRRQAEDILHALYTDHCARTGAAPLNPERFIAALQHYLPPMAEGFQPFPKRSDQSNQLLTVKTFVQRPNTRTGKPDWIRPYKGAHKHFEGVNAFILPPVKICRESFCEISRAAVAWPDIVDHERSWFELCQERLGDHASIAAWFSWKLRSARSVAFDPCWRRRIRLDYLLTSYQGYCERHGLQPLEDEDEFWNAFWRLLPKGRPPALMLWEKQRCGEGKDFEWCRVSGLLLPDVNFCRTHFAEVTGIDERTFGEPEMSEEIDGNPRTVDRYWQARLCRGLTAPDELDVWQTELYWNRLPASYLLYCGYLSFCRDERCRAVGMKFFLERLFGLLPTCETVTLNLYRKRSDRWTIEQAECLILQAWEACAEHFEHETGNAIQSRGPVTPTPTHSLAQMTVDKLLAHWWGSLLGRDQGWAGQWGQRESLISCLLEEHENGADYVAVLESCSIFPSMPRILLERRFRNFLRRHGLVFDAAPALTAVWDGMFSALSDSVTLVREAELLSAQSCSASPDDVDPDWLDFGEGPCPKRPALGPGGSEEWYEFKSLEECRKNFELTVLGRSLEWPTA
jgi:hypothetical protein